MFLLYYPLKQGLKQKYSYPSITKHHQFLLYYPLKQGLKHNSIQSPRIITFVFLLYYPLKQGLKLGDNYQDSSWLSSFYSTIH